VIVPKKCSSHYWTNVNLYVTWLFVRSSSLNVVWSDHTHTYICHHSPIIKTVAPRGTVVMVGQVLYHAPCMYTRRLYRAAWPFCDLDGATKWVAKVEHMITSADHFNNCRHGVRTCGRIRTRTRIRRSLKLRWMRRGDSRQRPVERERIRLQYKSVTVLESVFTVTFKHHKQTDAPDGTHLACLQRASRRYLMTSVVWKFGSRTDCSSVWDKTRHRVSTCQYVNTRMDCTQVVMMMMMMMMMVIGLKVVVATVVLFNSLMLSSACLQVQLLTTEINALLLLLFYYYYYYLLFIFII